MVSRYCTKCGKALRREDVFCAKCGTEARETVAESTTTNQVTQPEEQVETPSSNVTFESMIAAREEGTHTPAARSTASRQSHGESSAGGKWCPNPSCLTRNKAGVTRCAACGSSLDASAPTINPATHTLVWLAALIPLVGILIDLALIDSGQSVWWSVPVVYGLNVAFTSWDKWKLDDKGYNTASLTSAWIVPVYLFKRISVAGGGNGYGVLWVAMFLVSIAFSVSVGNSSVSDAKYISMLPVMIVENDNIEVQFRLYDSDNNSVEKSGTATIQIKSDTGLHFNKDYKISTDTYQTYQNQLTGIVFSAATINLVYNDAIRKQVTGTPVISLVFATSNVEFEELESNILDFP